MRFKFLQILTLFGMLSAAFTEIPKRAFRMYERGDIPKTIEALEKSFEKDSLNPGAYYLYSILSIDTAYSNYDVDSAYLFVNKAIEQFTAVTDPKELEDFAELGVDSLNLERQKDKVDSLKYLLIIDQNTIAAYNAFLDNHIDAKQIPDAIKRRDRLAFEAAARTNTWQSYLAFKEKYPKSIDRNEADKRYKKLIYEERTADGSLSSLSSFLEEFPQSPYREQVEFDLFPMFAEENTIEVYRGYLEKYPNERRLAQINNRLFHIYKERYPAAEYFNDFDFEIDTDSLNNSLVKEQSGAWYAKLEGGKISWISASAETQLQNAFDKVGNDCLCNPLEEDILLGTLDGQQVVMGRDGGIIYRGQIDSVRDAGHGLLIVKNIEGERLINKAGEVFIELPVEEIRVFNESMILTKRNGFYGIETIMGSKYLDNEFIAVEPFGDWLLLEKEDGIQLIKLSSLDLKKAFNFNAQYDEIEDLENGKYWTIRNEREAILDKNLNPIIPFGNHQIYDRDYGFKLESDSGVQLYHDKFIELKDSVFSRILENDRWLALEADSTWSVYDQLGSLDTEYNYDSVALWGENMLMLFKSNQSWAQFKNGKKLVMEAKSIAKLLVPQNYITTGEKAEHDFFMVTDKDKRSSIYNDQGKEILNSNYRDVAALGPNLLRLQKRNAALVDSTGNFLLNFIYDGIGSNNKGYVSILDGGKVGVINPALNFAIKPEYDKLLEPYNDSLLIVTDDKYKGFIDIKNEQLTSFEFDQIEYLNDTLALTLYEEEWLVYDIYNDEAVLEGLVDYEFIKNNNEQVLIKVTTETGIGVFDLEKGEVIEFTFTDIKVLGTEESPLYFAVKFIPEASLYVIIYIDENGNNLFTQSLKEAEYFKIACPSK